MYIVQIATSWLGQYICHKGEGVVLKLERKTHTHTGQASSNVWTGNIQAGEAWWQNIRLLHKMWNVWVHLLPPLRKMLVLHASLSGGLRLCVSHWCFVWSQTGHDQTVLPWSSWRANLLCEIQVEWKGERLSSMAGWTVRGGKRAGWRNPCYPRCDSSLDGMKKIKAVEVTYPPACYTHVSS